MLRHYFLSLWKGPLVAKIKYGALNENFTVVLSRTLRQKSPWLRQNSVAGTASPDLFLSFMFYSEHVFCFTPVISNTIDLFLTINKKSAHNKYLHAH